MKKGILVGWKRNMGIVKMVSVISLRHTMMLTLLAEDDHPSPIIPRNEGEENQEELTGEDNLYLRTFA